MSRPDPFRPPRPGDGPTLPPSRQWEYLRATLASRGDDQAAIDLALDLVLHEIVEQARQATGVTGAAVALSDGSEMVCRATSGDTAPDLGARLNTEAGLSAECLRTGQLQMSDDTNWDLRVDPETCRRLGIRSVVVMPLVIQGAVGGVFEAFSPDPWAFRAEDVKVMQELSCRIVAAVEEAVRSRSVTPAPVVSALAVDLPRLAAIEEEAEAHGPASFQARFAQEPLAAEEPLIAEEPARGDWLTPVLGVLIVILALALGWVLGRSGWEQAGAKYARQPSSITSPKTIAGSAGNQVVPQDSSGADAPGASAETRSVRPSPSGLAPARSAVSKLLPAPAGGLVIYEKGRVVFSMGPAAVVPAGDMKRLPPASAPATATQSGPGERSSAAQVETGGVTGGKILHRIAPVYPPEARDAQVQGPVVLQVLIGKDGSIQDVKVISGDPRLAPAAVAAVRLWRYEPYRFGGQPIEHENRVIINFALR